MGVECCVQQENKKGSRESNTDSYALGDEASRAKYWVYDVQSSLAYPSGHDGYLFKKTFYSNTQSAQYDTF